MAFAIFVWLKGRKSAHRRTQAAFTMAFVLLCAQIILGIVTVLYGAPVQIAIVHQLLAVILWVTILRARFLSAYPITTSLRGN